MKFPVREVFIPGDLVHGFSTPLSDFLVPNTITGKIGIQTAKSIGKDSASVAPNVISFAMLGNDKRIKRRYGESLHFGPSEDTSSDRRTRDNTAIIVSREKILQRCADSLVAIGFRFASRHPRFSFSEDGKHVYNIQVWQPTMSYYPTTEPFFEDIHLIPTKDTPNPVVTPDMWSAIVIRNVKKLRRDFRSKLNNKTMTYNDIPDIPVVSPRGRILRRSLRQVI